MSEHTITVKFDDAKLSVGDVVAALNGAGYTVPDYSKLD